MRHGKKFNHLSRKAAHRSAMLSNMACSLILHKRIKTTVAKAKALRMYVEPILTKSKNDTTHSRRMVFSSLKQKEVITELFGDVAAKIAERNGGYTRILKTGNRLGDNAEMCFIELVDFNQSYTSDKPSKKKTRRRGGKSSATENTVAAQKNNAIDEKIVSNETESEQIEEAKNETIAETSASETTNTESVEESSSANMESDVVNENTNSQESASEDTDNSQDEKNKE